MTCPRKWAFKYVRGFKGLDEAEHLVFGSAVHESQAEYYLNDFSYDEMLDKASSFLQDKGGQWYEKLKEKVNVALDAWYEDIGQHDAENMEVLECEAEDSVLLPNGFRMSVRRDRVLRDKRTGEIFINDTKTTGWSLDGTIRNYMLSDQPILYIASIKQNKPEWFESLSGWRTDAIYVRKLKSGWKTQCRRSDVSTFTSEEIDDCLNSYASITSDIAYKLQCTLEDKEPVGIHFPCHYSGCLAYNRECEYKAICTEVNNMTVPPSNFEVDSWLEKGTVLDGFKDLKE